MNQLLRGVARAITDTFPFPEPILEVGSFLVEGQDELADLRKLFPGGHYTGLDVREGPGVDVVASVESLPFADDSFGAVIAMSTFEHVERFWKGFDEIRRVLRCDGVFLVSCPFHVRIHNHPSDYWRFTPEAFQLLLEDYPQRILGWHGTKDRPENVWAFATREEYPRISEGDYQKYLTSLSEHAKQPIPWGRKLRYRMLSLFDRKRLCAPYLEVGNWESEIHQGPNCGKAQTRTTERLRL
ncbi:MAG: class I SAM-dependent methyltransferase [Gemmataceae bacterium]